jgi:hypothetical protein
VKLSFLRSFFPSSTDCGYVDEHIYKNDIITNER